MLANTKKEAKKDGTAQAPLTKIPIFAWLSKKLKSTWLVCFELV